MTIRLAAGLLSKPKKGEPMTTSIVNFSSDRAPAHISPDAAAPAGKGTSPARKAVLGGRILTGLATLFLLFDAGVKLVMSPEAVAATAELGWPAKVVQGLGWLELVCLALYLIPRTAPLGAVLWTGYLGGAIAAHLRLGNPLFTHTLFPIYVAALIWGGLWLRDRRVRALLSR
jgi:hypothetical protein